MKGCKIETATLRFQQSPNFLNIPVSLASQGPTRRLVGDSIAYLTLYSPQSGPRAIWYFVGSF